MVYKKGLASRWARSRLPGAGVAKVASKALYIASKTARLLNVEKKYIDRTYQTTFDSAVYSMTLLNGLEQGDGGSQRDGDQAKFLSLQWKGRILNRHGTDVQTYRMIIFQDRQADGTAPNISELLEYGGTADVPYSGIRMDNKMRFKILHDEFYTLNPTSLSGQSHVTKGYKHLGKKGQGLRVRYGGATASVADLNSNPIYVVIVSNQVSGQSSRADIIFRLRYVDN